MAVGKDAACRIAARAGQDMAVQIERMTEEAQPKNSCG